MQDNTVASKDKALNLGDNEKVLFQSRFSVLQFLKQWAMAILACAASLAMLVWLRDGHVSLPASQGVHDTLQQALQVTAIAAFLIFLVGYAFYRQRRIVLTTRRLAITSLWNLNTSSVVLRNISNIEKRRSLIGLMFGYGTIQIQDTDGRWLSYPFVPRVDALETLLANTASMQPGPIKGT